MMSWTRGQLIGYGSTATVSIATAHDSNEVFAVKSAELTRSEFLIKEQRIMAGLNCPQIVSYKGWDISSEAGTLTYNLWMEYAPHGTVADAVCSRGGSLDEDEIRSCAREILLGLDYLHSMGIVHCDIKGQNVLLTDEGAKIADFGCAKQIDDVAAPAAGTPMFMAPEVARGEHQGFPADVWAVGCTVIEMATGRSAWAGVTDPISALYRIGFSKDVPEIPEFMSMQGKDFMRKCLRSDPLQRWTVQQLLKHPFLKESVGTVPKRTSHWSHNSPTTVLDQGIWFETETEEAELNVPDKGPDSPLVSPVERIKKLSVLSGPNEMPLWELGANWVDVRGSTDSESLRIDEPTMANSETTTFRCQNCGMLDSIESARTSGSERNTTTDTGGRNNAGCSDSKDLTVSFGCKSNVKCDCFESDPWQNEMKDSLLHSLLFRHIHSILSLG